MPHREERDDPGPLAFRTRPSRTVKTLASEPMAALDTKSRELEAMKRTLSDIVMHGHGDARPDCPILDSLAQRHAGGPSTGEHGTAHRTERDRWHRQFGACQGYVRPRDSAGR